jgi:hypothetical protein
LNVFHLKREQWVRGEHEPIEMETGYPIYVLAAGTVDRRTGAVEYPRQESAGVDAWFVREFLNPGIVGGAVATHGVAVYRLVPASADANAAGPPSPDFDNPP